LKRALRGARDKDRAFRECGHCPALFDAFMEDVKRSQALARERVQSNPDDEEALFFLSKLDLNYAWLQAGTLGRKTGWTEYREARRTLDALLERNPTHLRARVARAWIDYIVDTEVPWALRWLFGGGNRTRALTVVREAAAETGADRFASAEARFGLWDMLVRERNIAEAVVLVRELAKDFPDNPELPMFLGTHDPYYPAPQAMVE
jgi:hypothetical protein